MEIIFEDETAATRLLQVLADQERLLWTQTAERCRLTESRQPNVEILRKMSQMIWEFKMSCPYRSSSGLSGAGSSLTTKRCRMR